MLRRSKSVLDRTSSGIEARIRQIREGSGSSTAGPELRRKMNRFTSSDSAKEENEIRLSKAFSQKKRRKATRHLTDHFRPGNVHSKAHPAHLAQRPPGEPEPQPQEDVSDMSSSSDDEYTTSRSPFSETKPLPKPPAEETTQLANKQKLATKSHLSRAALAAQNRHYSYVPGDDSFDWRRQRPRVAYRTSTVKEEVNQDGPDTFRSSGYPGDIGLSTFLPTSTSSSSFTSANQSQIFARHPSQWGPEKIKRGDSNSSQVTAIRDKSARSSIELGSGSGDVKQQTSNAAIAAALRAMSERKA